MRSWLFLLGGLLVWAAHFIGVYAIVSVADVVARANAPAALTVAGLFTLVCALADGWLLRLAWRRARSAGDSTDRFVATLAGLGAGVSLIAVLWQGFPVLIGP